MPATPKKPKRFGGSAHHQRLLMANLAASLFAAEGIVTTEAKAKALRPIAEKLITKARRGGMHNPPHCGGYVSHGAGLILRFLFEGVKAAALRGGRFRFSRPPGPAPASPPRRDSCRN